MSKKVESPNEESRKIKFEFNGSPHLWDPTPFERLEKENQGYPKYISKWPEPRSHVPQPTPHPGPRPQKDARFRSPIPRKIK